MRTIFTILLYGTGVKVLHKLNGMKDSKMRNNLNFRFVVVSKVFTDFSRFDTRGTPNTYVDYRQTTMTAAYLGCLIRGVGVG